jgi:hypothetical protein
VRTRRDHPQTGRAVAQSALLASILAFLAAQAGAAQTPPEFVCPTSAGGATAPAAAPLPPEPFIALSSPEAGATVRGQLTVAGWAVDPYTPPGPNQGINPRDVQLWVRHGADEGRLEYATFGEASPDAAECFGAPWLPSGFARVWETCSFPPGAYDLWVQASSLSTPGAIGFTTADLTVQPCPPGTELYRADFRDSSAWRALPSRSAVSGPDGDGWTIRQQEPGTTAEGPTAVFANFRAEVTTRLLTQGQNRYTYLQFREVAGPRDTLSDGFYRLSIDPGFRSFDLARWDGEVETILIPETRLAQTIQPAGEDNRLAVVADGARLRVLVNDSLVGEVTDATYPWGRISFGVGTGGESSAAAHFRDFTVTTLPAAVE